MLSCMDTSGTGTTVSCFRSPSFPMAALGCADFGDSSSFSEDFSRASPWVSSREGVGVEFAWCAVGGAFACASPTFISDFAMLVSDFSVVLN